MPVTGEHAPSSPAERLVERREPGPTAVALNVVSANHGAGTACSNWTAVRGSAEHAGRGGRRRPAGARPRRHGGGRGARSAAVSQRTTTVAARPAATARSGVGALARRGSGSRSAMSSSYPEHAARRSAKHVPQAEEPGEEERPDDDQAAVVREQLEPRTAVREEAPFDLRQQRRVVGRGCRDHEVSPPAVVPGGRSTCPIPARRSCRATSSACRPGSDDGDRRARERGHRAGRADPAGDRRGSTRPRSRDPRRRRRR